MPIHSPLGLTGEQDATDYLKNKNFVVLERNFYVRGGEIDIICLDGDCLVFVEVKARKENSLGKPYEAIKYTKLMKMRKVIWQYLQTHQHNHKRIRIDVVSVEYKSDLRIKNLNHYKNISIDDV